MCRRETLLLTCLFLLSIRQMLEDILNRIAYTACSDNCYYNSPLLRNVLRLECLRPCKILGILARESRVWNTEILLSFLSLSLYYPLVSNFAFIQFIVFIFIFYLYYLCRVIFVICIFSFFYCPFYFLREKMPWNSNKPLSLSISRSFSFYSLSFVFYLCFYRI